MNKQEIDAAAAEIKDHAVEAIKESKAFILVSLGEDDVISEALCGRSDHAMEVLVAAIRLIMGAQRQLVSEVEAAPADETKR